ncbi:MAG: hypothetical protein HRT69_13105 [Flavobacteriaceae bacterium]|nr:hypothetical protein [Flavobacteriaceae bacterium]
MKRIIYILTILIFTSCSQTNIPDDVTWKITKEEPNLTLSKNNIEIELNKKVTKNVLKEIALELRKDRKQYDKLWVFYHLEDMVDGVTWATSHFTPNLEIEIIGSTQEQDLLTKDTTFIDGEILGKWRSEKSLSGATLVLFKSPNSKLKMRITFKDGSKIESDIKESKNNSLTRFEDDNEHGEFYILETNGNLGMYSHDGKFDEAIKLE